MVKQKVTGSWRLRALTVKAVIFNLQSKARSGASVEAHYDIGNDLYTRMLDPRMVYTCGYWKNAKNLTEAQEHKLDLVARKVGLKPGMKVLDLGCGRASSSIFLRREFGVQVWATDLWFSAAENIQRNESARVSQPVSGMAMTSAMR